MRKTLKPAACKAFEKMLYCRELQGKLPSLLKSWRRGPFKNYESTWEKFTTWCGQRQVYPFYCCIEYVVNYLGELFENILESIALYAVIGLQSHQRVTLHEMCPNTEFFLVRIFPHSDWIRRDTSYLSIFSQNAGKYGAEKSPYLDIFHAVLMAS